MTKRFCDTEIWIKDWFIDLDTKHKLLIKFLFDNCDCAGIYNISWKLLGFLFGEPITLDDFKQLKQVKIIDDNTLFIEDFVLFQQSLNSLDELNPNNKAHLGIIRRLNEIKPLLSPFEEASEGLQSPPSNSIGNSNSNSIGNSNSNSIGNSNSNSIGNSNSKSINSNEVEIVKNDDLFVNPEIEKCFNTYEQICSQLPKLRFERRNIEIRKLTAQLLNDIGNDLKVFRELCIKANELRLIVDTPIDFKKMIKNYMGILNGSYKSCESAENSADDLRRKLGVID